MSKNYVAKTTIDFSNLNFYVRPGDILVHDTKNKNSLTVYRNGEIVKTGKQDPLGIAAFLKNGYIQEVSTELAKTSVTKKPQSRVTAPEPVQSKPEPKKQVFKAAAQAVKKSEAEDTAN
jgi:hypothetical protein